MAESTSNETWDELLSSVKGKAKEVAAAVTGNDSLAAEGQLQQAEARARKQASAQDAVAHADAADAGAGRVNLAAHILAGQQTIGRISDARDGAARAAQETHRTEEKARRD